MVKIFYVKFFLCMMEIRLDVAFAEDVVEKGLWHGTSRLAGVGI